MQYTQKSTLPVYIHTYAHTLICVQNTSIVYAGHTGQELPGRYQFRNTYDRHTSAKKVVGAVELIGRATARELQLEEEFGGSSSSSSSEGEEEEEDHHRCYHRYH